MAIKDLDYDDDPLLIKIIYYLLVVLFNSNIDWLKSDVISIRGGHISGFGIYVFASGMMLLNFYIIYVVSSYFEKLNKPYLSKKKILNELLLSPFFILFAVTLFVQWTPFFSLHPAVYIAAYICIFYFQYRFWKRMENYSESFKTDSGEN